MDEVIDRVLPERRIREDFIRHTDAHLRPFVCMCVLVLKNFFFGQRLYTSAVAMVTQFHDRAKMQDWLERSKGGNAGRLQWWDTEGYKGHNQTQR